MSRTLEEIAADASEEFCRYTEQENCTLEKLTSIILAALKESNAQRDEDLAIERQVSKDLLADLQRVQAENARLLAVVDSAAIEASQKDREIARLQMELDASCNAEELRQVREQNARLRENVERLESSNEGLRAINTRYREVAEACKDPNGGPLAVAPELVIKHVARLRAALNEATAPLQAENARLRAKADECWGAANYRLKYLACLFRALGMDDKDRIENRISEAAERITQLRAALAVARGGGGRGRGRPFIKISPLIAWASKLALSDHMLSLKIESGGR